MLEVALGHACLQSVAYNPLLHSVAQQKHLALISISNKKGSWKKFAMSPYESVDDRSLIWDVSQKSTENRILAAKS